MGCSCFDDDGTGLQIQAGVHTRTIQELRVSTNLLQLLHDFVEGGLQLLGHRPLHGCQLHQRAIFLQPTHLLQSAATGRAALALLSCHMHTFGNLGAALLCMSLPVFVCT